jgi:plasmid stability protein
VPKTIQNSPKKNIGGVKIEFEVGEECYLDRLRTRAKQEHRSVKNEAKVLLMQVLNGPETGVTNSESATVKSASAYRDIHVEPMSDDDSSME